MSARETACPSTTPLTPSVPTTPAAAPGGTGNGGPGGAGAAQAASASAGSLPRTGSRVTDVVPLGLALVLGGAGLLVVRSRTRRRLAA